MWYLRMSLFETTDDIQDLCTILSLTHLWPSYRDGHSCPTTEDLSLPFLSFSFYWRQVHILLGVSCVVGIAMNWHNRHVRSLLHSIDSSIPLAILPLLLHSANANALGQLIIHLWCHLSPGPQANTEECKAGLNKVQLHYPPSAVYSISRDVWDIN